jgi:MtaA/CmuA family methyltransferase
MPTRRSILETALQRKKLARIPCFPLVDVVFASAVAGQSMAALQLDSAVHARGLERSLAEYPLDGIYINLCFSRRQASHAVFRDGVYSLCLDDCLEINFAENDVAAVLRTDISSLADPRLFSAELFHPGMLETFQEMSAAAKADAAVCVGLTGAFSQIGFLYGLQNLMLAMLDEPDKVTAAIDRRQEIVLQQAEELIAAGARFLWIGEGMASGSLISPALYRRFVLPYERELARAIRQQGAFSILHVCGNITPMLADIAESEVDCADIDAPTDWEAAVKVLGPKISLKGNLNPVLFLPTNVERLDSACDAALRTVNGLPGHILSTGCLVPRDSCREAFDIMARYCDV